MLTEADKNLIENVRHWESARSEQAMGLIDIIDRQSKALARCVEQRDLAIDDIQIAPNTKNVNWAVWCKNDGNEELEKIMQGGGSETI